MSGGSRGWGGYSAERVLKMETAGTTERGGAMGERNALPIDYLTHISTSDL